MPIERSKIHPSVKVYHEDLVNIYDSEVGEGTKIATFVEIGGSKIGKQCKIEGHAFIPPGSVIEDYVFVGPGVRILNDRYPKAFGEWKLEGVVVKKNASIGAGTIILPGLTIGEGAMVGAGALVTKDVPPNALVYGIPAKVVGKASKT
jgi:acetyltransferase-like isoleucine patch superfamily enzyme